MIGGYFSEEFVKNIIRSLSNRAFCNPIRPIRGNPIISKRNFLKLKRIYYNLSGF